jgi:tetratricopeptide (TPR) repeat protein
LKDDRSLAMVLNSLGGAFQRQGKFNEAVDAFQRSYEISERLKDDRSLAMVLNSLGGVYQRQGRFAEALDAFQRSYGLLVQRGDRRGQAMVLNSLGVLHDRMGNVNRSIDTFERSLSIGEELNDRRHLAMAHTSFGRTLLNNGDPERGAAELSKAFAFEESIKSRRGIQLVTPLFIRALIQIGRSAEVGDYLRRALIVAPSSGPLLRLQDSALPSRLFEGTIKSVIRHQKGHRFGFVTPAEVETFSKEIYFHERDVLPESLPAIGPGVRVNFEIGDGFRGPQAKRIKVIG